MKQRRCDPLREYLDEIPPKSAAAVGTALTDDIFSKPLETAKVGTDEVAEVKDKVDARPKVGEVDERPTPKVQDTKAEIENKM